ncbi:MAG: TetR/AcrR family transcriptional regulator [Anaerolineales bacterium]|nr:TetR/AcrR family transcriptional regulator [Anaerolineales bacterium]
MTKKLSVIGRPRNTMLDNKIMEVTCQHLAQFGYLGMSIEGVAQAAGVSKTSIYRRYPDKRSLAASAIASLIEESGKIPDTGNILIDVITSLEETQRLNRAVNSYAMIGALLIEEQRDPELLQIFREKVIFPRRMQLHAILSAGVQRGDLRKDTPIETLIDIFFGIFIGAHLRGHETTIAEIRDAVQIVLTGISMADSTRIMKGKA